ncbi:uncharacterized protein MELLADRAFT_85041 [Melampsora larici-populina 98AG31]|uniref:Uncharacterized protein n=1 Tax=Melampsora larici-populina (strain 98AG31 / pathotype 3-4-7) TaxID=747676 RepID=F4RH99_MELLP|nr:uncharacterized protein MELLADRAFT_85041 [Melampsora larici-populina 98AG31]EGG08234.1 hypothetical protein MELLADRAFT_85041 [Melampsora larici-populina 98AG31]
MMSNHDIHDFSSSLLHIICDRSRGDTLTKLVFAVVIHGFKPHQVPLMCLKVI